MASEGTKNLLHALVDRRGSDLAVHAKQNFDARQKREQENNTPGTSAALCLTNQNTLSLDGKQALVSP